MFDDYEDDDTMEIGDETSPHAELIQSILEEANVEYEEVEDDDGRNIFRLKNGVVFKFDDDGSLISVDKEDE